MVGGFLQACHEGDLKKVIFLVEKGVDIHASNDLAFHLVSTYGYLDIMKYLIEKGVDIHLEEDLALRYVSIFGHLHILEFLIEKGVDIHTQEDLALRWAAFFGHLNVVKRLVKEGMNRHAEETALGEASFREQFHVVKYFLDRGINNPNTKEHIKTSKYIALLEKIKDRKARIIQTSYKMYHLQ